MWYHAYTGPTLSHMDWNSFKYHQQITKEVDIGSMVISKPLTFVAAAILLEVNRYATTSRRMWNKQLVQSD